MPISIEGKRIIITGGARGMAADTVRYLAKEGSKIVIFDILDELAAAVAAEANAAGPGQVFFQHVDVSNLSSVKNGVAAAVEQLGGLDGVFNIAGIAESSVLAEDLTEAHWERMIGVDLKGIAYVCQSVFPHLKDAGGSIVNIASDAGLVAVPEVGAHYSAAKSGVFGYTRKIASEWGRYLIRCNCVNPVLKSPTYEAHMAGLTAEEVAAINAYFMANIPLGGQPGDATTDFAPVLAFLASDASKFITSQIIGVNGGMVATR